jgi:hydrogenase maturation protease
MNRIVVLAWGNPGRGDDGLGPAFAQRAEGLSHDTRHALAVETDFQLQPEHAVDLLDRDAVLFVDASVAAPEPFSFGPVDAARDRSFTSHAMSPAAVLAAFRDAFGEAPPAAYTLAIRGEAFELGTGLSAAATARLEAAVSFFERLIAVPAVSAWRAISPHDA